VHVSTTAPEGDGWERDPDVLDTWFSSGLWPFVTLGWPDETPELAAFYPTDVLSTARDILFLWVARMVMLGLELTGDVPFRDVYVHSVIQAPGGQRMSKSLGTGIDPLLLISGGPRPPVYREGGDFPAYGTDALRFGLLAMSSTQDVRFSEEKLAQGQALANKLFNAARFVMLKVPADTVAAARPAAVEDRWILSRLESAKVTAAQRIADFDFSKLALGLYDFVYADLCDWYLELIKGRELDEDLAATLLHVLSETIALTHPLMPFVTEDLWAELPGHEGELLAQSRLPVPDDTLADPGAEAAIAAVIEAVTTVRSWRNEAGVAPGEIMAARLNAKGYEGTSALVGRLARLDLSAGDGETAATIVIPGGTVEVHAAGAFDPAEAQRKAQQAMDGLRKEIARAEGKLGNEGFVAKAPDDVVQAERDKVTRLREELARLEAS
jgi:valyl-tRNA synthetase